MPFAKSIVPVVKVAEKRVEVMPPSGLLDLTTSKPMRKVPYKAVCACAVCVPGVLSLEA